MSETTYLAAEIVHPIYELKDVDGNPTNRVIKLFSSEDELEYEKNRLLQIKHIEYVPHILSYYPTGIVMTKIPGKRLNEIEEVDEVILSRIVYKLLLIIRDIHSLGVIHGNICSDNVVYDEENKDVYLVGFGCDDECVESDDINAVGILVQEMLSSLSVDCETFVQQACEADVTLPQVIELHWFRGVKFILETEMKFRELEKSIKHFIFPSSPSHRNNRNDSKINIRFLPSSTSSHSKPYLRCCVIC